MLLNFINCYHEHIDNQNTNNLLEANIYLQMFAIKLQSNKIITITME